MKKVRIISLASHDYSDYLLGLSASISCNMPTLHMISYLVNSDREVGSKIKSLGSNFKVKYSNKSFKSEHQKRCFCAGRRAWLFVDLLNKYPGDTVVWIDVDSLFRKYDSAFVDHVTSCGVSVRVKNDKKKFSYNGKHMRRHSSGCFSVSDISFAKRYLANIQIPKIFKNPKQEWMRDQNELNITIHQTLGKVKFKTLPDIYSDVWMRAEGIIWHAKSKSKNSKIYQDELRRYLAVYN